MRRFHFRRVFACLSVVAALALIANDADARAGGGSSFGSRGSRTFSAPPATRTAPTTAAPMERSMTQPGQPGSAVTGPATPARQPGGFFNRPGLLGGLAAGFLGAGLFGLLLGNGFLGGLGSLAGFLGLILQIGLVLIVARLLWAWWQRRHQPAFAGGPAAGGRSIREMFSGSTNGQGSHASHGGAAAAASSSAAPSDQVGVEPADFDAFERLLTETQTAYGAEDLAALRQRVTPEMLSYFSDDLAQNASRGVVNKISDVKLEQGDLAEAWREGDSEYATVAMRYSLNDHMVDRASGRVVEGDTDQRQEATELWTFRRAPGGAWLLSAIQQA